MTLVFRWKVFCHEYIRCVELKEKGFDRTHYKTRSKQYVPKAEEGHCQECCLPLTENACDWCNSETILELMEKCE